MLQMNNTKKLEFNKKIFINFNWWEITWNWWLLALAEFNNKLQIEKLLDKYFKEIKSNKFIHTKSEIIYQKIIRIISWYSSNNNYKFLKNDPIFKTIHKWKIASSATCSRLENTFNYSDESKLRKIRKEIENYNISQTKASEIIIDLDTTKDPCSENLEYASFIPHYWINWYTPIFAFNWLNWDLIDWILKPWKYHCSTLSYTFTKNIIKFYKWKWIKNIILRADSAFPNEKIMWLCEKEKVYYTFKLKSYQNLKDKVMSYAKRWKSVFVEIEHQAKEWSHSRRVIACIDWKIRETEESKIQRKKNPKAKKIKQISLFPVFSFIVTNNQFLSPEEIFSMYNWRATIEKSIEEAKNWFNIDHLSNSKFKVNATNFQIYLLAIQILQLFRKFTSSKKSISSKQAKNKKIQDSKRKTKKFKKPKIWRKIISLDSIDTIRKKVFHIPAKIIKTSRKIVYKCVSNFAFQNNFMKILQIVQRLPYLEIS